MTTDPVHQAIDALPEDATVGVAAAVLLELFDLDDPAEGKHALVETAAAVGIPANDLQAAMALVFQDSAPRTTLARALLHALADGTQRAQLQAKVAATAEEAASDLPLFTAVTLILTGFMVVVQAAPGAGSADPPWLEAVGHFPPLATLQSRCLGDQGDSA